MENSQKTQSEAHKSVLEGITLLESGLEKIMFNDEAFKNESWYYDWMRILENRISCFKECFEEEFMISNLQSKQNQK